MTTHTFRLFADYFQIYLMDDESRDDTSEIWTDGALKNMLAVGDSALAIGTLRNVDVDVVVEMLSAAPDFDEDDWDHIVAAHISVPTGRLAIFGCTDYLPDAARITIVPGHYEVLYRARGFDTIQNEWDDAEDIYEISLWPGHSRTVELIKHWRANERT